MTFDQTVTLVGSMIIAAVFFIIIPICAVRNAIRNAKRGKPPTLEERLAAYEPDIKTFHAEVIDIACGVYTDGGQSYTQPRAVREFCVKFREDDGSIRNVLIPEELYDAFDIGQRGSLTLIDGNINSFVPDEDPSEE